MSPSATLSLCMIVRDEAEMLPRCLAAVRGLWSELLVVDTGSRDGTVAVLEGEGARVIHRVWDDDFSAARNAGLEQATGDWILCLDADEIVSPGLATQMRPLLGDPGAGAATVVIRNHLPHGHRRDASVLRLFRNHPSVRFQFPIHEDVTDAVRARLAADGRRLRHLPGVVEHLGYVRAHAASRNKKARDTELLLRCLEHDRGDLYSWFKLLELARFWGDRVLWSEAATSVSGRARSGGSDGARGQTVRRRADRALRRRSLSRGRRRGRARASSTAGQGWSIPRRRCSCAGASCASSRERSPRRRPTSRAAASWRR